MIRLLLALLLLSTGAAAAGTRTVEILDRQGFETPTTALTLEVPAGWRVEGEVVWRKPCSGNDLYELLLTVVSPDGGAGLRLMPSHALIWTEISSVGLPPEFVPMFEAQIEADRNRQRTAYRGSNCHLLRLEGTEELLRSLVLPSRPAGARVVSVAPNEAQRRFMQASFSPPLPGVATAWDAVTVTMRYAAGAREREERLALSWYGFQSDTGDGGYIRHMVVEPVSLAWYPPERRAEMQPVLDAILASARFGADWLEGVRRAREELARQRAREQQAFDQRRRDIARQRDQQHAAFIAWIQQ